MSTESTPSASAVRASNDVRAVIRRLRRKVRAAAADDGFVFARMSVLGQLMDNDHLTVSDLAAIEGMRHQSMAATIAGLAELGMVERRRDPDDGRRLLIGLTAEGRRQAEAGRQARGEWLAGELEHKCTEEERQTVIAAMAVLERLVRD
ncbi:MULTISPECIES: MarR family winged helix-turn-helix transcriptional regulator [Streptomycetaceae]|uniref:MarR family winged helix-turn-helix transcriptional regulator n=1 Tax=Streptomycetaceae TaxID=2062 RepID=UPI00300A5FD8